MKTWLIIVSASQNLESSQNIKAFSWDATRGGPCKLGAHPLRFSVLDTQDNESIHVIQHIHLVIAKPLDQLSCHCGMQASCLEVGNKHQTETEHLL